MNIVLDVKPCTEHTGVLTNTGVLEITTPPINGHQMCSRMLICRHGIVDLFGSAPHQCRRLLISDQPWPEGKEVLFHKQYVNLPRIINPENGKSAFLAPSAELYWRGLGSPHKLWLLFE